MIFSPHPFISLTAPKPTGRAPECRFAAPAVGRFKVTPTLKIKMSIFVQNWLADLPNQRLCCADQQPPDRNGRREEPSRRFLGSFDEAFDEVIHRISPKSFHMAVMPSVIKIHSANVDVTFKTVLLRILRIR